MSTNKLSRKYAAFTAAGAFVALAGWAAYRDYKSWLALGTGGLPGTVRGWLQTSIWRMQKVDAFDTKKLRDLQGTYGDIAALGVLPHRATARPNVGPHPVPHRQLQQHAASELIKTLQAAFDKAAVEHSDKVLYKLSHFERHVPAITCSLDDQVDPIQGSSHGEIAHIHPADGSMHMILSPSDAVVAIEAGWAELHGLCGKVLGLPSTYLLVYSPQSHEDVAMASRLLRAAIAYMTQSL